MRSVSKKTTRAMHPLLPSANTSQDAAGDAPAADRAHRQCARPAAGPTAICQPRGGFRVTGRSGNFHPGPEGAPLGPEGPF